MTTHKIDNKHQLSGDWTIFGLASQAESLTQYLRTLDSGSNKNIRIDCEQIAVIDISGLQLLHVWMQCARVRGIKTRLVNLSESMQQSIQRLGFSHFFQENTRNLSGNEIQ